MNNACQRGQFEAVVAANVALCREHFRLVLKLDGFPPTEPGQFVQILCHPIEAEVDPKLGWLEPEAMLRRPFSLAGRRDKAAGVELDIIHRVVGVGTGWLSRLKEGDGVGIIGPLGNRFELPRPDEVALLVGGGVGIPPMLYLAEKLSGRQAVAFVGALSRDLIPLTVSDDRPIKEFIRYNIPTVVTTDDGSFGMRGFVTQALERFLDGKLKSGGLEKGPFVIYTCGPEAMMRRVADIAAARSVVCQVAVERAMACGMGTCQSCVIRVKDERDSAGWRYRLACTDGPVFRGAELLW